MARVSCPQVSCVCPSQDAPIKSHTRSHMLSPRQTRELQLFTQLQVCAEFPLLWLTKKATWFDNSEKPDVIYREDADALLLFAHIHILISVIKHRIICSVPESTWGGLTCTLDNQSLLIRHSFSSWGSILCSTWAWD